MERIGRCEKHDTTFASEEDSIFHRCFVCIFEENERYRDALETCSDTILEYKLPRAAGIDGDACQDILNIIFEALKERT